MTDTDERNRFVNCVNEWWEEKATLGWRFKRLRIVWIYPALGVFSDKINKKLAGWEKMKKLKFHFCYNFCFVLKFFICFHILFAILNSILKAFYCQKLWVKAFGNLPKLLSRKAPKSFTLFSKLFFHLSSMIFSIFMSKTERFKNWKPKFIVCATFDYFNKKEKFVTSYKAVELFLWKIFFENLKLFHQKTHILSIYE